jgi:type IV pilus assembly protein PilN
MIRINLLTVERQRAAKLKKRASFAISSGQRVTIGAVTVLLLTLAGLGSWYWSLHQQSVALDAALTAAESETRELRTLLMQVQQFEARKAQLQQRVTLIEELRKGQSAPVRVLNEISRSVPDRLWLRDLTQVGSDFTVNGFATSMTALSDFVAGLESTRWFRKPVEIIDSQVTTDAKTGDLVHFSIKATYFDPDAPPPPAPAKGAAKR